MFSSMLSLLGSLRGGSSFITRSLRFRSSASASLSRTFSAPTNNNVWTYSGWIKRGQLTATQALLSVYIDASNYSFLGIRSDDKLEFSHVNAGVTYAQATSLAVLRDPSAYMHIVIVGNRDEAIDVNRIKMYVNGVQITAWTVTPTWNAAQNVYLNQNRVHSVGRFNTLYFDGYLTDVNFIDGQALTPASFGAIDSSTGVWAPRPYSGTYGTNGFYLKFGNTSSVATLGTDSSGNNNTWTVNNVSLTAGATYDSMIDVPVNYADGGNGRGNYAVANPTFTGNSTNALITNGNLTVTSVNNASWYYGISTIFASSGKWYAEITSSNAAFAGIVRPLFRDTANIMGNNLDAYGYYGNDGKKYNGSSIGSTYGATWTTGDVIGVALDLDAGTLTFYKNGITQGQAFSGIAGEWTIAGCVINAGNVMHLNFGQRPFAYTPPAGFRALNTNNLPTPSIVNGANFMAATTYTGNAAARSLSNAVNSVSFQPDLVWIKSRTPGATSHALFDSTRGTTKYLSSDTTTGETTLAQSLTAFGADGFSLGTDTTLVNANANSYIAWQWKAGGAAVSNTQGTITSQVSANTTNGVSVVTLTAQASGNGTFGHGLGVAPKMVIVKLTGSGGWNVWTPALTVNEFLALNTTAGKTTDATSWGSTAPTSSVVTLGSKWASLGTVVAYCFAEIAGFSRFGSYTGNGLADGPFVFCGFRPRFIMVKSSSVGGAAGYDWIIQDTTRSTSNVSDTQLIANGAQVENVDSGGFSTAGTSLFDITSNGFKLRNSSAGRNASGATYIFAAFAEVPSKYALAR